jgi:DNA-binding response OmpR family regulator
MNKLLLVEDDEALALGIEFTLKDEGYEVVTASTIKEGKILFEKEKLDLIILDVNLPDGSGYELCKEIRTTSEVPIIFLTALDEEVNVIVGFEIGGDDYITKPFRVRELLSRIKAVLRRNAKGATSGSNLLVSGDIVINTATATVKKGDKDIILTAQEYKLLLIFMSKANVMMKREEILKELLEGAEVFFDENTLSVYIKRVREKIEDNPKEPQYIITARGLGYKWNKGVTRE